MKNNTLHIIIISGLFSILLLFVVQFFWAKNLVDLEQKQFTHKVKMGLINAGYQLKLISHNKIDKVHLVKQLNDESYVVEVQDIVNPTAIDSLLQKEFEAVALNSPYKIAIYDCFTDSVIYTQSGSTNETSVAAKDYGVDWDITSYNFGVIFPKKNRLDSFLSIGLASGLVILGITGFFVYVVVMFLRQKKLDSIKTDFINNMTHELKTPISTISLSSKVINDPKIIEHPERLKRYAEIIGQENERLKNQVDRVLQLAFFEQRNFEMNFVDCDIKQLLVKAYEPFELLLSEQNGIFEIEGDAVTAQVDEPHFTNAISNLIDNAIKYSGQKKINILAHLRQNHTSVVISISDSGIGMEAIEVKNIFKKFYRAPTGNVHNVKGFGIGLSYVDQIVQMHNGTINVKSKKNQGTTFEMKLPIKQN